MAGKTLSQFADQLVGLSGRLALPNPGVVVLAGLRRAALEQTLAELEPQARALTAGVVANHPAARREFAELAEAALVQLRRHTQARAASAGLLTRSLARLDAWWRDEHGLEHIDDPKLDPALRQRAMENLDRVNERLGSYAAFLELLTPALERACGRPLRIIDLAAGHAGFALALAEAARARGLALEITATDLVPEYLELAERSARARGLAIEFAVQDALDLSNVAPGRYDVVVCTQAIHHFAAGAVAIMLGEAARVAGHSVLFIDGSRTLMHAGPLYAYLRGRLDDPILAHDGWISCRRFFVPEELALLARLGPWGQGVRVEWMPPTHWVLRMPAWRDSPGPREGSPAADFGGTPGACEASTPRHVSAPTTSCC